MRPVAMLTALAAVVVPAVTAADTGGPHIAVVLGPDAASLREPLVLALRLEFPERTVEVVGADGSGEIAVVRVERTATGLRVRVEETATRVAVEREILVDASGDEAAAHAAALLARSLLGVALLYEPAAAPPRGSASTVQPEADERAREDEARPEDLTRQPDDDDARVRGETPRREAIRRRAGGDGESPDEGSIQTSVGPSKPSLLFLSAGALVSVPFLRDPARPGGRFALSVRAGPLPLEGALEIAVLAAQDYVLGDTTTATVEGIPLGAWARARLSFGNLDLVPGVGMVLEHASVVSGIRTYSDWNAALGGEARARFRVIGALHVELGLRGQYGLGGQDYRWGGDRVFRVGGSAWGGDVGLSARVL